MDALLGRVCSGDRASVIVVVVDTGLPDACSALTRGGSAPSPSARSAVGPHSERLYSSFSTASREDTGAADR